MIHTTKEYMVYCIENSTHEKKLSPLHIHSDYEIFLFLNGDVDLYIENSVYPMKPGFLAVINDHELHGYNHRGNQPFERVAIHINPEVIHSLSTTSTNLLFCFCERQPGKNNILSVSKTDIDAILNFVSAIKKVKQENAYGSDVIVASLLSKLLVLINKLYLNNHPEQPSSPPKKIDEIVKYIDKEFSETLSLKQIADHFFYNPTYLSRLFRKYMGIPLNQYLLTKKISLAKRCLSLGGSVTEACEQACFNDYNNFIRSFRQATGMSPGQYAKYIKQQTRF